MTRHTSASSQQLESAISCESRPLVSVIIPAYKVAGFIADTLESVLCQTFEDYEIIVINDGSPDTPQLEKQIEPYAQSITYLKQRNGGAGAARNAGIQAAHGEFVAFLDGDDVWCPNFLNDQLELIQSSGGYDVVYANATNFGISGLSRTTNMDMNPSDGEVTVESLISARCNVITSSVVARRSQVLAVGCFDERFRNSQDFDLWLRLAKHGARFTYQKSVLVHRRIYEGSLASNPVNSLEGEIKVLENLRERGDLTTAEQAILLETLELRRAMADVWTGKQKLTSGDFDSALRNFDLANSYFRSWKLSLVKVWLRFAPRLLQRVYLSRLTSI
ncbi:MAG TPA: glycosyltransferase [Pyrinomonadaceae bacterium]